MYNIFLFLSMLIFFACQRGNVSNYSHYLNHNDTVKYVGKEQCKTCHAEIYKSYLQTGMGKSFHFAIKEHSALASSNMPIIYDSINNLSYKPFWINDSLYLLEFRLEGIDTTHKLLKKVTYKIGSGQHTNSHLFEVNGYIHQVPYTFYTQEQIADLPPGFEGDANSRFSRKIGLECMTCHNAYPKHQKGSFNKYESVQLGIDCERCHGPGELHVKQKLTGHIIDTSKYIDYSIVNPAKLTLDLQFDVCQRCHLQGTAVLKNSASFSDFKPGMHLKDVMDVYLPKYKDNDEFIMASHVDRLKQSACFKSDELTCISCHNPHKSVTFLLKDYFDKKCQKCHEQCKDEQTENCSKCHMPRSSSSDIPHVSITDHKISIPISEKKQNKKVFQGLLAINNSKPTNLSKAKAYLKHFESFEANPIYLDSAFDYLQKTDDNFLSYIQYYYLKGDSEGMLNYIDSYDTSINTNHNKEELALALFRVGEVFKIKRRTKEAIIYYEKAIKLAPFILEYKIKLAIIYVNLFKLEKAEFLLKEVLELYPYNKEALLNLGFISMLKKNYIKTEYYLFEALKYDPDYIKAYENLVLLRIREENIFSAKFYLNKILEIAPNNINAKQMLNQL